jgi:hypothetical protein
MAVLIDNEFSTYELTDEELIQGQMLTITQRQVVQNQLSMVAAEKLAIQPDPACLDSYIQQEAYARGQIDALRYLLTCSDAAQEQMQYAASDEANLD